MRDRNWCYFRENNWLKMHGMHMRRWGKRRKRVTETDKIRVPFSESKKKDRNKRSW